MVAFSRTAIPDFHLDNPIYAGAQVTFYTVDANGDKTSTKATLYDSISGSGTLENPQELNSRGRFDQPVYIAEPVIGAVSGLGVVSHDTGIIGSNLSAAAVSQAQTAAARALAFGEQARSSSNAAINAKNGAQAAQAAAELAANQFPSDVDVDVGDYLRRNASDDGYEARSPSQLLADLVPTTANTYLRRNAANTDFEAKTSDEVREDISALKIGKNSIWIPAGAMTPRQTNGPAMVEVEVGTNLVTLATLDFDATTQEYAQFSVLMPPSWDGGTVTFRPVWAQATTNATAGVVFELAGAGFEDADDMDIAFGTAQSSTDAGGTENTSYIGPESSAITLAGAPVSGGFARFQITRDVADGSDTLAQDAKLIGVLVFYTMDAEDDS